MVSLPDKTKIFSTHTAELQLPDLPPEARHVHLFPALQNTSLLSIGQLCDSGCTATFTANTVTITRNHKPILTGTRSKATNYLWDITLPNSQPLHHAHAATGIPQKTAEMVQFSHAALNSPSLSTLTTAIQKGFVKGFPGLTATSLHKYPPTSVAMHKGHMDQTRKNQRSTKPKETESWITIQPTSDNFPPNLANGKRTHSLYAATIDPAKEGMVFTDQTGRLPKQSKSGNNYLLILYDYDSNYIHAEPIPNRSANCILTAYQQAHCLLVKAGLRPKLQRLDNECSTILKEFLQDEEIDFQLTPPGIHRRNAAERAIRTFKNHFIATLSSTDPAFPISLWDKLIPQALITLNLLRGSRMNPKLSAYAQVKGEFDYNRTPLAPPGIRVLIHEKPDNRPSWGVHGEDAWYIGPAIDSYRCYKTWVWKTKSERISDTITWFPHYVKMPTAGPLEILATIASDIQELLTNKTAQSPLSPFSQTQTQALKNFSSAFQHPVSTPTEQNHSNTPTTTSALRVEPPDPALRVEPPAPALRVEHPAPALRVDEPYPNTHPNLEDNSVLRVNQPTLDPISEANQPNIISQEEDHETNNPPILPEITYEFESILNHTDAPRGTGSSKLVQVKWKNYKKPTWEPTKLFTDNFTNEPATQELVKYAQNNNLLNTKGFKNLQAFVPFAGNAQFHKPTKPIIMKRQLTLQQRCFFHQCLGAIHPDTGRTVEYPALLQSTDGEHWEESNCEEIGRLAQGYLPNIPKGTNTLHFVKFSSIPKDRKVAYLRLVVADRPLKANPRRVRWTVGGDQIDYPGDVSTKTSDMLTTKILINSTLSTPGAKFCCADLKDFYLNTPLPRPEYIRVPLKQIPTKMMDLYNLHPLVHNGYIYAEVTQSMYGLPQAGRISNDALIPILANAGYHQSKIIHGLFKHETRPIAFALVVDDFGIKYVGKEHADHLFQTLTNAEYKITIDWEGTTFCGLHLKWDYQHRTCDLSMPGYVQRALQKFEHPIPKKPQDSPHRWTKPQYGAKQQMTKHDISPNLDQAGIKHIQGITGTFLYYARGVDPTMMVAVNAIASAQSNGTEATLDACCQLLNYAATHPNATIRFTSSDMMLIIHSDASYLSESKSRSRAGGHFFLGSEIDINPANTNKRPNGAIHVLCNIMPNVLASATEAEVGALFHNAQDACHIRNILEFLGHPQPATPIQVDNACAEGIINETVKAKRTKAMDMRYYWVRDRVKQGQFFIHWKPGTSNLGDYHTKHHPTQHHRDVRPVYLYTDDETHQCNLLYLHTETNQANFIYEATHINQSNNHCEGVLILSDYTNKPMIKAFPPKLDMTLSLKSQIPTSPK